MNLTDEMLYQYAGEARDLWLSTLPQRDAIPEHVFSRRFIRKMNRLLRQQRRSPNMRRVIQYTRNAAIFVLVLTGVTFAGLMTVEAYRGAIIDVITDKLSNILTFEYSSPIHEENAEFVDIELHYMPEGMVENELGFFETTVDRHRQFENGEGGIIELNEWLISADRDFSVGMLTEDTIAEEQFLIGNEQATMITRKDDTSPTGIGVSVMWTHGDVAYAFYTNLSAEEAKKIVLNIEYLPYDAEAAKAKREAENAAISDTVVTRDYLISFVEDHIALCEITVSLPPVDEADLEDGATMSQEECRQQHAALLSKLKPFFEEIQANATDENAFDYWEEYWEIRGEPMPDVYELETERMEQQKPALMEEWGLHFTEEEVNAAIAVAQQYYKERAEAELDPTRLTVDLSEMEQYQEWLKQGVDIKYDKDIAFYNVYNSGTRDMIEQQGPGTWIELVVTIPAATDYRGDRRIMLTRENAQAEWTFLTEGPNV